jgi:hypothetical protein
MRATFLVAYLLTLHFMVGFGFAVEAAHHDPTGGMFVGRMMGWPAYVGAMIADARWSR